MWSPTLLEILKHAHLSVRNTNNQTGFFLIRWIISWPLILYDWFMITVTCRYSNKLKLLQLQLSSRSMPIMATCRHLSWNECFWGRDIGKKGIFCTRKVCDSSSRGHHQWSTSSVNWKGHFCTMSEVLLSVLSSSWKTYQSCYHLGLMLGVSPHSDIAKGFAESFRTIVFSPVLS